LGYGARHGEAGEHRRSTEEKVGSVPGAGDGEQAAGEAGVEVDRAGEEEESAGAADDLPARQAGLAHEPSNGGE